MGIAASKIYAEILNQLRKIQKKSEYRGGIPYELILVVAGHFVTSAGGAQRAFAFLKKQKWLQERASGTYSVPDTAPKMGLVGEEPVPLSTKELNRLVKNYKTAHPNSSVSEI